MTSMCITNLNENCKLRITFIRNTEKNSSGPWTNHRVLWSDNKISSNININYYQIIDKLDFIKIQNFAQWKTLLRKEKVETGRKYFKTTYLTKDLYQEYKKNSRNWAVK
jgi:hypothetical protein